MRLFKCFLCIVLCWFLAINTQAQDSSAPQLIVQTKQGKVQGIMENNVLIWKGIRYAQAPIGELRFKAPQPPESWEGIRLATEFGTIAPQQKSKKLKKNMSEDCLFLNIWETNTKATKRPVMFWIHGGGFYTGSGSHPIYNGASLVEKGDVIVVTINYRLGPLGFLYFDKLKGDNKGFENNLGIRDQIAALKWVKENIENFGGDPDNITVFGQSAGAVSVLNLMSIPSAKGLFHKAIAQSPAINQNWTPEQATVFTKNYMSMFGITENNISSLYTISTDSLISVADRMIEKPVFEVPGIGTFAPTIDGEFITGTFGDSLALEQSRKIPLLIGTNRHEMNVFLKIPLMPFAAKKEEVHKLFVETNRAKDETHVTSFYRKYPSKQSVLNICTDGIFRIPSIGLADCRLKSIPTYMYRFDWNSIPLNLTGYKACHSLELFFVFKSFDTKYGKKVMLLSNKRKAYRIANKIQEAWINFARTGDPNNVGSYKWKSYNSEERATMIFDRKTRLRYDPDRKYRMAWDGLKFN